MELLTCVKPPNTPPSSPRSDSSAYSSSSDGYESQPDEVSHIPPSPSFGASSPSPRSKRARTRPCKDQKTKHTSCEGCRFKKTKDKRTICGACKVRKEPCVWSGAAPVLPESNEVPIYKCPKAAREIHRLRKLAKMMAFQLELDPAQFDLESDEDPALLPTTPPPSPASPARDTKPGLEEIKREPEENTFTHLDESHFPILEAPSFASPVPSFTPFIPSSLSPTSGPLNLFIPVPASKTSSYLFVSPIEAPKNTWMPLSAGINIKHSWNTIEEYPDTVSPSQIWS